MNTYIENLLHPVVEDVSIEQATSDKGEFVIIKYLVPRQKKYKKLVLKKEDFLLIKTLV